MSHPGTPMDPEERKNAKAELHNQVCWALEDAAPEARRIDLRLTATGGVSEAALTVTMPDGAHPAITPPQEAIDLLMRRRPLSYVPGEGTWFSARYVLEPPNRVAANFNYDGDPRWSPPIPADVWAHDLEEFPRDEEYLPDWLRARAAGREPDFAPSNAVGGLTPEDQREIYAGEILTLLVDAAPPDWVEIMGTYRAVGDHIELPVTVRDLDHSLRVWEPPQELSYLLDKLRAGMYYLADDAPDAGRGTWSQATFQVQFGSPSRIDLRYAWDTEPEWESEPSEQAVRHELDRFPRIATYLPNWMRDRAGLSSPEGETPEGQDSQPDDQPPGSA